MDSARADRSISEGTYLMMFLLSPLEVDQEFHKWFWVSCALNAPLTAANHPFHPSRGMLQNSNGLL